MANLSHREKAILEAQGYLQGRFNLDSFPRREERDNPRSILLG